MIRIFLEHLKNNTVTKQLSVNATSYYNYNLNTTLQLLLIYDRNRTATTSLNVYFTNFTRVNFTDRADLVRSLFHVMFA